MEKVGHNCMYSEIGIIIMQGMLGQHEVRVFSKYLPFQMYCSMYFIHSFTSIQWDSRKGTH